jgi:RNA polymerase sigma-70 factor (ECF subfamily)
MDPDLELLERWRAGDREAGGDLLARYFNMLRVYFITRVPERSTEDLIQEVFARMIEARDRFETRCSVRTFLTSIARHVFHETVRELYRPDGRFDPLEESMLAVSGRTQSSLLAHEQELQLLLDALQRVTIRQHEMLELHYFHGYTVRDLAEVENIPAGTANGRLQAARRALLREFVTLLGPDATEWTEDAIDRGLVRVRDIVLQRRRNRDERH